MAKPGSARTRPLTLADVERLAREHGAGDAWDSLTPAKRRQWAARVREQQGREQKAREEAARRSDKANDRFFEALSAPVLKERAEMEAAARKKKR
jgi:hypothetical protein